jgi:transposase
VLLPRLWLARAAVINEETVRIETVFRKLLGVTGMSVKSVTFNESGLVIDVAPRWRQPRCSGCNEIGTIYDTAEQRAWRHLALGRIPFWLRYAPRRVDCECCGVLVEKVPWAAQGSRFTREFEELAAYLAQKMDRTAVTKLLAIAWRTVGSIVERIVETRLDPQRLEGLYVIGVDEISYRKHHHYLTLVLDHFSRRIVWARKGRSSETLGAFFDELGPKRSAELTHVTLDLSAAFNSAVDERAPQAIKVFDRFHIQRLASDAVDRVRRGEVQRAADQDDSAVAAALKRTRWALLKSPWNLSVGEGQKLKQLEEANQRLFRGYLLKESLAALLDLKQPGRAKKRLLEWLGWASRSRLKPFVKLARTLRSHLDGIIAYVATGLSNGPLEGLNNKARLITRRAFGFHDAQAFISMLMLCCGGIKLDPPLPAPTGTS